MQDARRVAHIPRCARYGRTGHSGAALLPLDGGDVKMTSSRHKEEGLLAAVRYVHFTLPFAINEVVMHSSRCPGSTSRSKRDVLLARPRHTAEQYPERIHLNS